MNKITPEILNRALEFLNENSLDLENLDAVDRSKAIYSLIDKVSHHVEISFDDACKVVDEWLKIKTQNL